MVQQDLLILADVVTELTLEPARTKPPVTGAAGTFCPLPAGSQDTALPGHAAGSCQLPPAVGDGLDVGQQVHLECVALLEGLPTLWQKKAEQCSLPARSRLLPAPHQATSPQTLSHMCGFSVLCVFMCCVSLFCMG